MLYYILRYKKSQFLIKIRYFPRLIIFVLDQFNESFILNIGGDIYASQKNQKNR